MFKKTLIALAIAVMGTSCVYADDLTAKPEWDLSPYSSSALVAKQIEKVTQEQEEVEAQASVDGDGSLPDSIERAKQAEILTQAAISTLEKQFVFKNESAPFLSINYKVTVIKSSTKEAILNINAALKPNSDADFAERNQLAAPQPKMVFDGAQDKVAAQKQLLSEYRFVIENKTKSNGVVETSVSYAFTVADDVPPVIQTKNGSESVKATSESLGSFVQQNVYDKGAFVKPITEYQIGNYIIVVEMIAG
jgi:hypothetical protein